MRPHNTIFAHFSPNWRDGTARSLDLRVRVSIMVKFRVTVSIKSQVGKFRPALHSLETAKLSVHQYE